MSVLLHDFDAPSIAADRCGAFSADPDEPGICTTCGWLHDEHQDADELRAAVAA